MVNSWAGHGDSGESWVGRGDSWVGRGDSWAVRGERLLSQGFKSEQWMYRKLKTRTVDIIKD